MMTNKKGTRTKASTQNKQANFNTSIILFATFIALVLIGCIAHNDTVLTLGVGVGAGAFISQISEYVKRGVC